MRTHSNGVRWRAWTAWRSGKPGLLRIAELEFEPGALLGREVELRTYEDLSRYFRDDVRAQARLLYTA